jgi:hypothetical protein
MVFVRPLLCAVLLLVALADIAATAVSAATLEPRTNLAYDAYLDEAKRKFVLRVRDGVGGATRDGTLSVGPARQDGIIELPGGLVHHWVGSAFVRGVTLRQAIDASSNYARYSAVYKAVIAARLLEHEGDTFRVLVRVRQSGGGISATLDVRSIIRYVHPTSRSAYSISDAEEIREVINAGKPDDRLLPAGHDSGYLWRANTFSYLLEEGDGLYIELETIGLSRRFPPLLAWFIEPIARRVGRTSVESSLREFLAVLKPGANPSTDR